MAATTTAPMLDPPGEDELQDLFKEVWDSYKQPSYIHSPANVANIPSDAAVDSSARSAYSSPTSPKSHNSYPTAPPVTQPQPPPPPPPQSRSSRGPGRARPLPPTPGSMSSSSLSPMAMSMPEPDPYHDSDTTSLTSLQPSSEAYSPTSTVNTTYSSSGTHDLLRKATTGSAMPVTPTGRKLPTAPGQVTNGLPSVRPPSASQQSPYEYPSPGYNRPDSAGTGISNARPYVDYAPSLAVNPNVDTLASYDAPPTSRPPGASPPQLSRYDWESPPDADYAAVDYVDFYVNDEPPTAPSAPAYNGYAPQGSGLQRNISASGSYTSSSSALHPSQIGGSLMQPPYGGSNTNLSQMGGIGAQPAYTQGGVSLNRGPSTGSFGSNMYYDDVVPGGSAAAYPYGDAGAPGVARRPTEILAALANYDHEAPLPPDAALDDGLDDEYWEDEDEEDESRFVNFSLLSHIAVRLRDKVPRGTHVKGSIPYPRAFTGKDIVSTIQSQIQRELAIHHGVPTSDRRAALQVARSLQSQLFFYEVEWGGRVLQDGVEDVYMFMDDHDGGDGGNDGRGESSRDGRTYSEAERAELPTGVITVLTKCYAPNCGEGAVCYSWSCPRKGKFVVEAPDAEELPITVARKGWLENVPKEVLSSLPESEIKRQTIIHKAISKEVQYVQDLDTVETCFLKALRKANPPVIPPADVEDFIDDVFGNILDLRECNKRLLEVMYVRQREQAPVIQRIGDVFLDAATEFRLAYPIYVGHLPLAEKRLKDETESNGDFRVFLEQCSRDIARPGTSPRLDLKHFLNRPSEHLQKYPVLLEAICDETADGNPDADYLKEAIEAIKNLQTVAQLRTFQSAMGKGVTGKWEWHDLVSPELRKGMTKEETKRQSIIFELIKGEMAYVKDLENIEIMYIRPLCAADPPIIAKDRLHQFIVDVFHNYRELFVHHKRLVDQFHDIQREEHPRIRTVTAAVFDAALNFREAYMEYIPNYPIAAYRIDDEMANNPAFKMFVEQCVRHPDAHRLDMKSFINRPIPRLLRYELLLKGILDETLPGHEDRDAIPQVLDVIKALGKETEPGVVSAKQKVELWRYNSNLVFKPGESIDMDLLDENRSLIYTGKLLRQPDTGFEWNGWSELFVLLFDNYMVMTKPKEKDGITKYHVNRRPIPLDLLTLVNFTDPPTQRSTGLLRGLRGGERYDGPSPAPNGTTPESATDSRSVFPLTLHHNGRLGGPYILYAETSQSRTEWKSKMEEALGLRKVVQESNKVFEVEILSADTFSTPTVPVGPTTTTWSEQQFTGKVTCSVPFNTPDGRGLVAIGCAEGVWIGFRHDSRSMRRVLHLKMVTQCAMLEDFGIFLVLADKSLFAYHIEALVPSTPASNHASQTPQKLNGTKDVHFFSVGNLHGRTLVIYMKKKNLDSVFRVLEPVIDKINEKTKTTAGFGSKFFRSPKSEWFRIYRDFFLPSESFDLIFLKAKIAVLCTKGFEIMDLTDFKSVTIPQRDDPRLEKLAKRCESCRPVGMFRSAEDEFLLCYDEFGFYVDKHGDPSRGIGTIEWEGSVERVALHPPYILLFDPRFIEVRHIETGRLAQIIPGNDLRCIWDGRGVNTNVGATPATGRGSEQMVQEALVHGVMNTNEPIVPVGMPGARAPRAVAQHVFELIPTIPLYLPGSLASPTTTSYFPQSMSPPRSPQMGPSTSWRS
ncbi:hypothetical protein HGRIS_005098 [Hohenbuehelia grisea]|uniref:Uncharacterized protein n=1 Tax=Hohenbuehelia grisea TaxID=104357 RepID=A0ABR3JE69_9AGAR